MRRIRSILLAAVFAAFASTAQAATIQFVDTYAAAIPVLLDSNGDNYSFTHDISFPGDNSLVASIDGVVTAGAGYDSLTDTLTSGTLTFYFSNCSGPPCTNGSFSLTLGGLLQDNTATFQTTVPFGLTPLQIALINNAGQLSVTITRTNAAGSLNFVSSVLDVSGRRSEPNGDPGGDDPGDEGGTVPEPGTLALLALGLVSGAARARRRA